MLHVKYLNSRHYGSGEENFHIFHYIFVSKTAKSQCWANLIPRVMIWTNLVEDHKRMLCAKYLIARHYGFREGDFLRFHYIFLCKTSKPLGEANLTPRVMI